MGRLNDCHFSTIINFIHLNRPSSVTLEILPVGLFSLFQLLLLQDKKSKNYFHYVSNINSSFSLKNSTMNILIIKIMNAHYRLLENKTFKNKLHGTEFRSPYNCFVEFYQSLFKGICMCALKYQDQGNFTHTLFILQFPPIMKAFFSIFSTFCNNTVQRLCDVCHWSYFSYLPVLSYAFPEFHFFKGRVLGGTSFSLLAIFFQKI